jgi:hypothetical protein
MKKEQLNRGPLGLTCFCGADCTQAFCLGYRVWDFQSRLTIRHHNVVFQPSASPGSAGADVAGSGPQGPGLLGLDRRGARRWRAAARLYVAASLASIICGRWQLRIDITFARGGLPELLQKRAAPPAAGARAEAFAHLTGALRPLDAKVIDHLALGDVKAEAEFFVEIHEGEVRMTKSE